MAEKKQAADINEVTEGMSKLDISDGKAVVTIGRWEPPHLGHSILINSVIDMVLRDRDQDRNTKGFVYISPRPDELVGSSKAFVKFIEARDRRSILPTKVEDLSDEGKVRFFKNINDKMSSLMQRNPLTQLQKWYYLSLMYPNLKDDRGKQMVRFLMLEYPDRGTVVTKLLDDMTKQSFNWKNSAYVREFDPDNITTEDEMQTEGRMAIKKIMLQRKKENLKKNYRNWTNNVVQLLEKHRERSPSVSCINYLKDSVKAKYVEIVVGSDRLEAFSNYNQRYLDSLPEGGTVSKAGEDRGSVGSGGTPIAIQFPIGDEGLKHAFDTCTMTDRYGISKCGVRDGVFSGTILRGCVKSARCNGDVIGPNDMPLDYFVRGVMFGDMEPIDAYCLLNDIASESGYLPIKRTTFNDLVSPQYEVHYGGGAERGGRKRKTRRKKGKGTIFSRRRNRENTSNVGKKIKDLDGNLWTIIREENGNVFITKNSSGSGGTKNRQPDGLLELSFMGPVLLSALEGAGWGLEKSGSVPGGTGSTQSGGKRKTRKRGRVPIKYVPKRLTKKDKKKARRELKKSRKAYKKGKYYTRKKVKSFKSKKSNHIINAMKIYGVKSVSASPKLAKKSGCSVTGLKKLVSKGAGAYYSSGSRPNQTAISWGRARMASAITGGKAAAVDFKILEKYCKPSSKALKLAKESKKKHGYGTRKVRKVKL